MGEARTKQTTRDIYNAVLRSGFCSRLSSIMSLPTDNKRQIQSCLTLWFLQSAQLYHVLTNRQQETNTKLSYALVSAVCSALSCPYQQTTRDIYKAVLRSGFCSLLSSIMSLPTDNKRHIQSCLTLWFLQSAQLYHVLTNRQQETNTMLSYALVSAVCSALSCPYQQTTRDIYKAVLRSGFCSLLSSITSLPTDNKRQIQ